MKAVVVTPGAVESGRIQEVPDPSPLPGQAVVNVIEVGVCGTDIEILEGQYGEAPPGDEYLIIGHENFGTIVEAPAGSAFNPGDHVVCVVRRPDPVPCPPCAAGEFDMCLNGRYRERGIKGLHGFMSDYYVEAPEYLMKVPPGLQQMAVLVEPLSIVEKGVLQVEAIQRRLIWEPQEAVVTGAGPIGLLATLLLRSKGLDVWTLDLAERDDVRARLVEECGATYVKADEEPLSVLAERIAGIDVLVEATAVPEVVFEAIDAIGPNGIVCLTGVSAGSRRLEVPGAKLNLEMVLQNKVVFGTVNANLRHYAAAVHDLARFESRWPGLCQQIVTRRVPVSSYADALKPRRGVDVKSVVSFSPVE